MKEILKKSIAFGKVSLLALRPHILLGWSIRPLTFIANTLLMTRWVATNGRKGILNDFPVLKREYTKRFRLYDHLIQAYKIESQQLTYLEFGVSGGYSFRWWLKANRNASSRFYGFDTFEGLPEDWGLGFSKGDMAAAVPVGDDNRAEFIKGLFQETLHDFLRLKNQELKGRLVIHLDADLFSSTLFALTTLAPHMKKGDLLIFDEFCVPNHEFNAFMIFTKSFYIKTRLVGAVNNYLQVAFEIE